MHFSFNCLLLGIYFVKLKGCHFYFPDETTTKECDQSNVKITASLKYHHNKIPDDVPEVHPDGELFSVYTNGTHFKYEIYSQVIIKFSTSRFHLVFVKLNSGHFCTFRLMVLPVRGQIHCMEIHQEIRWGDPRRYF